MSFEKFYVINTTHGGSVGKPHRERLNTEWSAINILQYSFKKMICDSHRYIWLDLIPAFLQTPIKFQCCRLIILIIMCNNTDNGLTSWTDVMRFYIYPLVCFQRIKSIFSKGVIALPLEYFIIPVTQSRMPYWQLLDPPHKVALRISQAWHKPA